MIKKPVFSLGMLLLCTNLLALANSQDTVKKAESAAPMPTDSLDKIPPSSFLINLRGMDLVDQYGHPFQPAGLLNHVVLVNFIFTHCGYTCPIQTRILGQVLRELPADARSQVRFVSVSIDPENDTPDQLQRFAKALGADQKGWSFLTGDAGQIDQLTKRLHLFNDSEFDRNKNRPQVHRTSLWLVDKQGRMLQRYRGNPPDKKRLVKELTQVSHMTIK